MKQLSRKFLSILLALTLLASLTLPAAASEALGEDLTSKDTLLNQETQLSTNVFWSTSQSDLRTENFITYAPNVDVTPIVTYGDVLTDRSKVSAMAKTLEAKGYRVVAGINGDFYNVNNGLPIGIVVTDGQLRSSDAGYYAIGFRRDGSAVLGKPGVKVTADLGYGTPTEVIRTLGGVNKARAATGGIYLYTYDFNAKHTTGNTEAGVDVVCTVEEGPLAIGGTVTLTVDRVVETTTAATAINKGEVVLSANLQSSSYYVDALRNIPVGSEITITVEAASSEWEDVEYAVGALYSLVENGAIVSGLQAGSNPRTAVGQKADGTLIFYTIDGRKSGHSIGASMTQVAQRMIELGCETALCLDGGGSTTLAITEPDETEAKTINSPSDNAERAVSNQIFLVADWEPSGRLSHFYVSADYSYVLAGSKVNISAAAVDTNFIPMEKRYDLWASDGDLDGNVLTTPSRGGDITVTAESGGKQGVTTVHAIKTPDDVAIRDASGKLLTSLTAAPGTVTSLTATAAYSHLPLKADPEAFTWTVDGGIGTIDQWGQFSATAPGTGTITVSAGGRSASISVTVSKAAYRTVEDFETEFTALADSGISLSQNRNMELVRYGKASGKLDYDASSGFVQVPVSYAFPGTSMVTFWVYGDNSGNVLGIETMDAAGNVTNTDQVTLDFTGWMPVQSAMPAGTTAITGLYVHGPAYVDENGETAYQPGTRGAIYLDQFTAAYSSLDQTAPAVTASLDNQNWQVTATVEDNVDGLLPKSAISVSYNGGAYDFLYDQATGRVTVALPGPGDSHAAMRVTITAKDGSGNIGRASVDVEPYGVAHQFTDINDYWAATYVDHLYNAGVTTGYDDGTFRPNQNITRAQFAVMLYRYLGLDESKYTGVTLPFADNDKIAAYAIPAIRALYSEGIINGSTGKDGRMYFNPNSSLTRAQAATMIGRTQSKGYATVSLTFTDTAKIPAYATYYIQTMVAQGIIGGYTDGSFRPNNNITRGQMAKILYNLM